MTVTAWQREREGRERREGEERGREGRQGKKEGRKKAMKRKVLCKVFGNLYVKRERKIMSLVLSILSLKDKVKPTENV